MTELIIRVVFSLGVVLGLLWFIARASSRRLGGGSRSLVRVVGRQTLGRNASVAVVEVGERVLVVGVSESGVRLLTEMDPDELTLPAASEAAFSDVADSESDPRAAGSPAAEAQPVGAHVARGSRVALGGSLLSGQTWRQAWAAAAGRNGSGSGPGE